MFHQFDGRRVHSVSFGAGPATLVAMAGSFADWEIWVPTFEILSRDWRVVAFDHHGVGRTGGPPSGISHDQHVATLFSVLDAQDVDRCVVAGDSAHAAVALDAALRCPDRFDGVVVVNGHAWGADRPEVRRFADALRTDFAATVDFFVTLVFPEPDSEHLQRWLRDIIVRTGPAAAAALLEASYDVDLRAEISRLEVPALVVHGVLDAVSPTALADAQEMAASIPDARLEVIPDAGHLPLLSRPDAVARYVAGFLAAHTGQRAPDDVSGSSRSRVGASSVSGSR